MEINLNPRNYQKAIFETAKKANTLVVLPTGLGKTLIALMLTIERQKKFPGKKALILAPTRPLIEQHFSYFQKNLPELFAGLQIFTGSVPAEKRKNLFDNAEIIFSTPQCIANDLENNLYNLSDVSLLVIDEAHRCLKNYDYTKVAKLYNENSQNPLILGLTASPGSDADKVRQICAHLNIKEIEVRTRESEDVRPYLQNLDFQKIEVPFPAELMEIRLLLKKIFDSKTDSLRQMSLLFGPANKISLLHLQTRLTFQSQQRSGIAMAGMSLTAQAIKISHALELLETQTLSGLKEYLSGLQKQANEKKSRGVQTLVKMPEFTKSVSLLNDLIEKKIEHPKIEELAVLSEKQFQENPNSKIIVFAQFRETAQIIVKRLNQISNIKASIFIGQAKKNNIGFSQKDQKRIIEEFKSGILNVLVATSIGEEGLDIPEVSAVIFYEPVPSAIRKIQRAGRTARLSPGKLLILVTKGTRDEIHHYASSARERKMHKILDQVKKELKEKSKNPSLDDFK